MNTNHEHPTAPRTPLRNGTENGPANSLNHGIDQGLDRSTKQSGASAAPENAPAADPFLEATDRLSGEFTKAYSALKRSLYVQRQALRLSLFDAAFKTAGFACIALTGVALTVAAALLFVTGVRNGILLLTDGAWWSDLALALALAGTVFLAARSLRSYVHRSVLARTRRGLAKTPEVPA